MIGYPWKEQLGHLLWRRETRRGLGFEGHHCISEVVCRDGHGLPRQTDERTLHTERMHPSSQFHKELAQIVRADDNNRRCCDCGKRNPTWASTNLGCFMCLECSGIHRAIGVHITKIKSITLDKWTRNEVDHMKKVGNRIHNARWEAFLDDGRGIIPQSSMRERDVFIRAKYNGRKYYSDIPKDQLPPPVQIGGNGSGAEAGKPKFQTAAQRAKMRREKAAREKAQKEAADREAAAKAKQDEEESARQAKENEAKMASRKKQMEARITQKQKEKEAARVRRQQRKNQRVRRRSKELSSLYPNSNSKASASSVDKGDALVGEVVSEPNTGSKLANENEDNLIDLMSGDTISHSPVTTPTVSDMGGGGGVSGFSFMSNANSDEGQQPQAPQVDTMVSGFSFLTAAPSDSNQTENAQGTSPMGMPSSNAVAIDTAFADLAALAPTQQPVMQDDSNAGNGSSVVEQGQGFGNPNVGAAVDQSASHSTVSLREDEVSNFENTLGQVQQAVQWYSEALTAYNAARSNLRLIEEKVKNANVAGTEGSDLGQRIKYLEEQVMATYSFIKSLPPVSK